MGNLLGLAIEGVPRLVESCDGVVALERLVGQLPGGGRREGNPHGRNSMSFRLGGHRNGVGNSIQTKLKK